MPVLGRTSHMRRLHNFAQPIKVKYKKEPNGVLFLVKSPQYTGSFLLVCSPFPKVVNRRHLSFSSYATGTVKHSLKAICTRCAPLQSLVLHCN